MYEKTLYNTYLACCIRKSLMNALNTLFTFNKKLMRNKTLKVILAINIWEIFSLKKK